MTSIQEEFISAVSNINGALAADPANDMDWSEFLSELDRFHGDEPCGPMLSEGNSYTPCSGFEWDSLLESVSTITMMNGDQLITYNGHSFLFRGSD